MASIRFARNPDIYINKNISLNRNNNYASSMQHEWICFDRAASRKREWPEPIMLARPRDLRLANIDPNLTLWPTVH